MAEFEAFGFYMVDAAYLEFLNSKDSEVYYNASYSKTVKPFVGIIINISEFKYFIPLTSAKEKHKRWKNVCDEHFIIYEVIDKKINIKGDIYRDYSKDEKIHILSVLDVKKMIPVPSDSYSKIIFSELEDERYKDLFRKEYDFCLKIKGKILSKAEKIYIQQKETKAIRHAYCDFSRCESALGEWVKLKELANLDVSHQVTTVKTGIMGD